MDIAVAIAIVVVIIFVILYTVHEGVKGDEAAALGKSNQAALDAEIKERQAKDQNDAKNDATVAAATHDAAGADKFLHGSFGSG